MWTNARKNAPLPGDHVFQAIETMFKLVQDISGPNLVTKFHDDRTINVAPNIRKNAPPPSGHVFKATETIFELIQDIIGTNLLTKFHKDRKLNVASRVLTRKKASPPGGHIFKPTGIIFKLVQGIIGMNPIYSHIRKNAPPLCSHVFQANVTIFKLIQYIIKTYLLTKFYHNWTIMKNAPPHDIIGKNFLTKFHEDRKINVASKMLTRKNAPPPGGHVFQPTGIIFELVQDIN
ncbi:hypothetical protein DPMN_171061 [Dreissena polymorpha]|uniref:Uncharacterized protein n=1 Tax=Dreissena polymorpha TaxID=45954 RepID=A0A9D4E0G1_DREPO|nr:hypothetical protein DPMN_171061 [Dreissena polymorpha]